MIPKRFQSSHARLASRVCRIRSWRKHPCGRILQLQDLWTAAVARNTPVPMFYCRRFAPLYTRQMQPPVCEQCGFPVLPRTRPAGTGAGIDSCTCAQGVSLYLCFLARYPRCSTMNRASARKRPLRQGEWLNKRRVERLRWGRDAGGGFHVESLAGQHPVLRPSYDRSRGLLTVHPLFLITRASLFYYT